MTVNEPLLLIRDSAGALDFDEIYGIFPTEITSDDERAAVTDWITVERERRTTEVGQ
jgi:hypothetical protein